MVVMNKPQNNFVYLFMYKWKLNYNYIGLLYILQNIELHMSVMFYISTCFYNGLLHCYIFFLFVSFFF